MNENYAVVYQEFMREPEGSEEAQLLRQECLPTVCIPMIEGTECDCTPQTAETGRNLSMCTWNCLRKFIPVMQQYFSG